MDIYSFISSHDIAEHCRKLEYEFTPLEMAIIVLISEKPITQRHEAWQWIIDSQPDMNMPIQGLTSIIYRDIERKPTLTLHSYLADYMRIENGLANIVRKPQSEIYYTYEKELKLCESEHYGSTKIYDWETFYSTYAFSSYEEVIQALKHDCESEKESESITSYWIHKRRLDDKKEHLCVQVTPEGEIIRFVGRGGASLRLGMKKFISIEDARLFIVFDSLSFHIPVPFKRGDIIIGKDGIFVLLSDKWGNLTNGINKFCVGGASNLAASLYMLETGAAYDGYPSFTSIDWEYYRGKLKGMNKTLEPISAHLKGELSIEKLLDAYLEILETEGGRVRRKELRSLGYYDIVSNKNTIEKLERAGLLPRKNEKTVSAVEFLGINRISKPIRNYLKGKLSLDLLMNAHAILSQ